MIRRGISTRPSGAVPEDRASRPLPATGVASNLPDPGIRWGVGWGVGWASAHRQSAKRWAEAHPTPQPTARSHPSNPQPIPAPPPSDAPPIGIGRRTLLLALLSVPLLARAQGFVEPTKAQPELPKEKLVIVTQDGRHLDFSVEMALTLDQQTTGLMFRKSVPPDGGMLFDWGTAKDSQMWMENTLVPLDMVFINADGTIRSIAEDTVPRSRAVIDSDGPVRATLELAAGTTARLNIRVGDKVVQKIFGDAAG